MLAQKVYQKCKFKASSVSCFPYNDPFYIIIFPLSPVSLTTTSLSSLSQLLCNEVVTERVQQESLADAKVSVRQQCVYESPIAKKSTAKTEQINDMRFPIDG